MTDIKLMDKLRKILALTNSPIENEATAAAEHLHRLLTAHNLSMADLEAKGGHHSPGVMKGAYDLGKAAFKWKLELADRIAEFYYCHPLIDNDSKTVAFVGRKDNVESLTMLYGWVIDQIKRLATEARRAHFDATHEHIDPLRWQLGFGEGAVRRLAVRLKEQRAREQEDAAAEAERVGKNMLMVMADARNTEISDWLEAQGLDRIDGKLTKAQQEAEKRWAEWREERARDQREKEELLASDPVEYYRLYPWEHPDAIAKEQRAREAKERRNARRRASYEPRGRYRSYEKEDEDERRDDQAWRARESGKQHADRINLQPFITGEVEKQTPKLKGKKA
jgi:hypothetical protein